MREFLFMLDYPSNKYPIDINSTMSIPNLNYMFLINRIHKVMY